MFQEYIQLSTGDETKHPACHQHKFKYKGFISWIYTTYTYYHKTTLCGIVSELVVLDRRIKNESFQIMILNVKWFFCQENMAETEHVRTPPTPTDGKYCALVKSLCFELHRCNSHTLRLVRLMVKPDSVRRTSALCIFIAFLRPLQTRVGGLSCCSIPQGRFEVTRKWTQQCRSFEMWV